MSLWDAHTHDQASAEVAEHLKMQGGIVAKADDEDALAITDPQDASYTVGNNTYRIKEVSCCFSPGIAVALNLLLL